MKLHWLLLSVLIECVLQTFSEVYIKGEGPIVYTHYGQVQGRIVGLPEHLLKSAEVYGGLQYSTIYGSTFRFMPGTVVSETWPGPRRFHHPRAPCPQRNFWDNHLLGRYPAGYRKRLHRISHSVFNITEDCLSLTLNRPHAKGKNKQSDRVFNRADFPTTFPLSNLK